MLARGAFATERLDIDRVWSCRASSACVTKRAHCRAAHFDLDFSVAQHHDRAVANGYMFANMGRGPGIVVRHSVLGYFHGGARRGFNMDKNICAGCAGGDWHEY